MAYTISNQPLTESDLLFIQEHLVNYATGTSIVNISEMDGFFTAVLSCADVIPFDRWYPAFWGGAQLLPKWSSDTQFQRFFDLLVQHMNQIALMLAEHPDEYSPIFNLADDDVTLDVQDWCYGYQRGVSLDPAWAALPDQEQMLHALIALNTLGMAEELAANSEDFDDGDEDDPELAIELAALDVELDDLMATLALGEAEAAPAEINPLADEDPAQMVRFAALGLYHYWIERRPEVASRHEPLRVENKVGRNDPCPCGSGKKFKQCCMT